MLFTAGAEKLFENIVWVYWRVSFLFDHISRFFVFRILWQFFQCFAKEFLRFYDKFLTSFENVLWATCKFAFVRLLSFFERLSNIFRKCQKYSPSEPSKLYDKAITRKTNQDFGSDFKETIFCKEVLSKAQMLEYYFQVSKKIQYDV